MNTNEITAEEVIAKIIAGEIKPEDLGDVYDQGEVIVQLSEEELKSYLEKAQPETVRELIAEGIVLEGEGI